MKRHAQDNKIQTHVRAGDSIPIDFDMDTLIRKQTVRIISLGDSVTLKSEAQKCRNEPRNACHADYNGCSPEDEGIEDAAVEEQDGDLDHGDGESISEHSGVEFLKIRNKSAICSRIGVGAPRPTFRNVAIWLSVNVSECRPPPPLVITESVSMKKKKLDWRTN